MTDRQNIFDQIATQVAPFNKKGVDLTETTTFAGDLEWDSLTVMDFVAAIEDEFDIQRHLLKECARLNGCWDKGSNLKKICFGFCGL